MTTPYRFAPLGAAAGRTAAPSAIMVPRALIALTLMLAMVSVGVALTRLDPAPAPILAMRAAP